MFVLLSYRSKGGVSQCRGKTRSASGRSIDPAARDSRRADQASSRGAGRRYRPLEQEERGPSPKRRWPSAVALTWRHAISLCATVLIAGPTLVEAQSHVSTSETQRPTLTTTLRVDGFLGETAAGIMRSIGSPLPALLTIRNNGSTDVLVEVRMGVGVSCDALRSGPTHVLKPGKAWLIAGNQPVCWRRAADAGTAKQTWMPWRQRTLSAGQQVIESISDSR